MKILVDYFPQVKPTWEAYIDEWGKDIGLYNEIEPFLDYLIEMIKEKNLDETKRFFYFIEIMLCKGDELIKTLAATGFLEGLLGLSSNHQLDFTYFSKYMGKKSVEYCQAWDNFCGIETQGLAYDPLTFKYEWEEGFDMEIKIENDVVFINANPAGLVSLANQLLILARDEKGQSESLEYNETNALEDGSTTLVINRK